MLSEDAWEKLCKECAHLRDLCDREFHMCERGLSLLPISKTKELLQLGVETQIGEETHGSFLCELCSICSFSL